MSARDDFMFCFRVEDWTRPVLLYSQGGKGTYNVEFVDHGSVTAEFYNIKDYCFTKVVEDGLFFASDAEFALVLLKILYKYFVWGSSQEKIRVVVFGLQGGEHR